VDWNRVFTDFLIDLVPYVLSVITALLTYGLQQLFKWSIATVKSNYFRKLLGDVEQVVCNAVQYTNQTFVDSLKAAREDGKLTREEAKEAFGKTLGAVRGMLRTEEERILQRITGDFEVYLTTLIERQVRDAKKQPGLDPLPQAGS
jgi:hypothetical protein